MSHTTRPPRNYDELKTDAQHLRHILEETSSDRPTWAEEEFGAILRHQLNVPVDDEHIGIPVPAPSRSLHALLSSPRPDVETLRVVKDYARTLRQDGTSGFPAPVATVLYYAAITAAEQRAGERISELDNASLREGCAWALEQTWLTDELRSLFDAGMST